MVRAESYWIIKEKISSEATEELGQYPNLIRQILFNRDIRTSEAADTFLRANSPEYSPFDLLNMSDAVETIHSAIEAESKIVVFGDYDVDGVTSSVILVQLLQNYQCDVDVFIPNRFDEGYGLSFDAVASVMNKNPDLIITVDCGVRSVKEVEILKQQGVKVVITDHHQPHAVIPAADAVICPKQPGDSYPFKDLAGVGIAYKLAQGLLEQTPIPGVDVDQWIDLVAIGTIADLAPLKGENRTLVRRGLRRIRLGQNKGLLALANVSGTNIHQVRSEDIGFRIGPRLNAAGRLDSAYLAFELLMVQTTKEAGELALKLDQENHKRQDITRDIQNRALEKYDPLVHKNFLFFWDTDFHDGVVGLAASKLVERFYRPAIVGVEHDGFVRASCRSIEELNITSALDECAEFLEQHGGHAMAAGLTVKVDQIDDFTNAFNEVCINIVGEQQLLKKIYSEAEVTFSELHPDNLRYFEVLEPLGNGNPYPLFVSRNISIKRIYPIGKEKEHLKLILTDGTLDFMAVAWRFAEFQDSLESAEKIDILYAYETNEYNGKIDLQLRIIDFKISIPNDGDDINDSQREYEIA
jgi:single-stranded-DNA-specific exonuclease